MHPLPIISVICICYNHARFLAEALDSVLAQTYPAIEIIVVDDSSTDNSAALIKQYVQQHPQVKFISTGKNIGNCAAFNMAWKACKGDYIIDFATDDVLLPERLAEQVRAFEQLGPQYGVVYTDAQLIDEQSRPIGFHYKRDKQGRLQSFAPSGDVFIPLLKRYFISPPTMMIRRAVLEELEGYDTMLAYEDFDFWIRSSRKYLYFYLDQVLTKRRLHARSLSKQVYKKGDRQLASTVKVCYKAAGLIRNNSEKQALIHRVKYELRHAVFTENFEEAKALQLLLQQLKGSSKTGSIFKFMLDKQVRLRSFWKLYQYLRYKK
ncbi:glycosyltransferase [Pontibacter sp. SGAir0037]|uniref:glycosyltransferase family 2 protein n=1 Tax=Pontibacter sp. SGAir0037 TaxID=2571030 RepID=UPI0010CD25E3|nr:glycosyltransferase [Pontibacter sp. SGAir0037]QCR23324.1 glycosyl transferase [Pontibacter sp. SGAir0037]